MWNNIEAILTVGTKNKLKFCITFDCVKDMQVRKQTPVIGKVSSISKTQVGKNVDRSFKRHGVFGKTEIIQIKD